MTPQIERKPDMTRSNDIRYRADGSIDTAFYMARGRHLRSCKAHELLGSPADDTRRGPTRRTPRLG